MRTKRSVRVSVILFSLLMVFSMMPMLPAGTETAYADAGDPAIVTGSGVLAKNVNTADSQMVWYGGERWNVIGHDGAGSAAARSTALTLYFRDTDELTVFNVNRSDGNAYGDSVLRSYIESWLFGGSRQKFTAEEQESMMVKTLVGGTPNNGQPGFDPDAIKGESVDALIWPLSVAEAKSVSVDLRSLDDVYQWLRSPGQYDYSAEENKGPSCGYGGFTVDSTIIVIRPVIDLNMGSVVLVSAAAGGKPETTGSDSLQTVGANSSGEWKLTMADAAHSGFAVTPVSLNDGILQFQYSGAAAGPNEYVSVLITDSAGTVKYYGKVKQVTAASGTVTANVAGKWDSDAGDRLYVFNEECNGDYKTDHASSLKEIDASQFYFSGVGTATNPYVINSKAKWDALADYVAKGYNTSKLYVRLDSDITVDKTVGTQERPFIGSFDGNGRTLTLNYTSNEEYCAPFRYVGTADFSNLRIAGTIQTSGSYASGLVGVAGGTCKITNCVCDADIIASAGNTHTGFISYVNAGSKGAIQGSAFTGSITGSSSKYCAGFIGWDSDHTSTIKNCVYAGTMATRSDSSTFVRTTNAADNSYYMTPIGQGRDKGKQALSVTGTKDIQVTGRNGTVYDVSGITACTTGLTYGGVFYAGAGETVSLDISASNAEIKRFTASAGTLTGSGGSCDLTMPEEDVIISFEWIKLPAPGSAWWVVNEQNGLLNPVNSLRATWNTSEDATGYYVTPGVLKNGNFTPVGEPIDVKPYGSPETTARDLTSAFQTDKTVSGELAFTVQAHDDNGLTSDPVRSDPTEVRRLTLHIFGTPTLYVRKEADVAGCLTQYFSNDSSNQRYISDGSYYFKTGDGTAERVLAFTPKHYSSYSSLSDLRSKALLVPGESTSAVKITGDLDVYALTENDLCTDGGLHSLSHVQTNTQANLSRPGSMSCTCTKCGAAVNKPIPQLKEIKTERSSYTYTGKALKPKIIVRDVDGNTVASSEYIVSYSNNTAAGTASVRVVFPESRFYDEQKTVSFKIAPANLSKVTVPSIAGKTYTGRQIKPTFTAKYNGLSVKSSNTKAFKITYGTNKNVGKGTIKITGKGNYSGTKTVSFKINPKGTTLKTPAAATKAVTVKWYKQSAKMSTSYITGYQIQLATDSKFTKNKKTVTVPGYAKISKKVTGLKGGRKYYVKIRTYKTVSGVKYYSPWSKAKTVTTKR